MNTNQLCVLPNHEKCSSVETNPRKSWHRIPQPYDMLLKKFKIDPHELQRDKCKSIATFFQDAPKFFRHDSKSNDKYKPTVKVCGVQYRCEFPGCWDAKDKSRKTDIASEKSMVVKRPQVVSCDFASIFGGPNRLWQPNQRIAYNLIRVNGGNIGNVGNFGNVNKLDDAGKKNQIWKSDVFGGEPSKMKINLKRRVKPSRNPITWEEVKIDAPNWRKCDTPGVDVAVPERICARPVANCRMAEVIRNPITGEEVHYARN